ncbi:MAG: DnaJ domain-containing protein [Bacteroidota bacterium]
MADFIDYYQILKVDREATEAEIRKAYRELAKDCHPDSNPSPEAHQAFLALGRAYKVLGDHQKRTQYNFRYDRHHGHAPKLQNNGPSSLERARAKRTSRYQRGRAYSSRIRYRGTASKPGSEETNGRQYKKGADPASAAQAEIYKRYAEAALAREEGKIKGYKSFARIMQVMCAIILGICLFMVVDKGLPVRKATETVRETFEIPWSIDKPGLSRVITNRRAFEVPRSTTEALHFGRQIRVQTSLITNLPLRVFYQEYGREYTIRVNSPVYGSFFPLIWVMIAMCLATLILRQNPEFNAYMGMITFIIAIIVAGIVTQGM